MDHYDAQESNAFWRYITFNRKLKYNISKGRRTKALILFHE